MKLIAIGFGNYVSAQRIVAVVSQDSAPVRRIIQDTKERGSLVDASFGRKTQSVLIMDSGHVILSALPPDKINARLEEILDEGDAEDE